MRKLITTIALLYLAGASVAIAQTAGPANPTVPPSLTPDKRLTGTAPVGHRQPRASEVPSENSGPNDPQHLDAEEKALDQKIKGICRGC